MSLISPAYPSDQLPDLRVNEKQTSMSFEITEELFERNSCALEENCVKASGLRRLLRFDTAIENVGNADLFLGAPESNPIAHHSSCHGHFHYDGMALYELLALDEPGRLLQRPIQVTRKQGFCMRDQYTISPMHFQEPQFDCDWQGLSVGWADIYFSDYDCQWLDITEVPAGQYFLRITVNPDGVFEEGNRGNNTVYIKVRIPRV